MTDSLFRISLKAFIQNDKGEVLFVKENGRDWWDLPGGGMNDDENMKEAMARELKEEVGYEGEFTMRTITYYDPTKLARDNISQVKLIFEVTPVHYDFSSGSDGDEIAFMSLEELKKTKFDERIPQVFDELA